MLFIFCSFWSQTKLIAEVVLRSLGWVHSHQRRESLDFPFSLRSSREEKCVARDLTYTAALQIAEAESHSPQNNCFHFPYGNKAEGQLDKALNSIQVIDKNVIIIKLFFEKYISTPFSNKLSSSCDIPYVVTLTHLLQNVYGDAILVVHHVSQ